MNNVKFGFVLLLVVGGLVLVADHGHVWIGFQLTGDSAVHPLVVGLAAK